MYASWPCPTEDGGSRDEMVLGFDEGRDGRVLIVPPLFDEANKFRHQIAEIMRRLDAKGIDCFCPDLPGCNESLAPLSEQSLAGWQVAVAVAEQHFRATYLLAIRSGCWLVSGGSSAWFYAPAQPAKVLRSMIRARILASREAGREEAADALMERGRKDGLTLAGWELGAALIRELEAEEFTLSENHTIVEQADIGGKPLWLRAENDADPAQADAMATLLANEISDE